MLGVNSTGEVAGVEVHREAVRPTGGASERASTDWDRQDAEAADVAPVSTASG